MTILRDIAPRSLNRVIDVVETALIDVSAWAVTGNAANARYRYEWASFDATSRVALFCFGHDDCLEDEGSIGCRRWSMPHAPGAQLEFQAARRVSSATRNFGWTR